MENNNTHQIALELSENMSKLISQLESLRKENKILKAELSSKKAELKDFQNNGKIANIVSGIDPKGENAEMIRTRIDENIQEIDNCIALLSNK